MTNRQLPFGSSTFLSLFEGLEGGFAIFSGILIGMIFTVSSRDILIATGLVGIVVSGFNSSAIKYTSEHYYDELDGREKRNAFKNYFAPALFEFLVYVSVCLLLLLPLLFMPSTKQGVIVCAILTVLVLFLAGYYRGWVLRSKPLRDGYELAASGLAIMAVGAIAGFGISLF